MRFLMPHNTYIATQHEHNMNAITLNESVTLPNNHRDIQLTIKRDSVRVVLEDRFSPRDETTAVTLGWDQVSDVELLSNRFDTEAVRTFKTLVEMLGKVHANKHIYEALV